jgi:hypothetical protein
MSNRPEAESNRPETEQNRPGKLTEHLAFIGDNIPMRLTIQDLLRKFMLYWIETGMRDLDHSDFWANHKYQTDCCTVFAHYHAVRASKAFRRAAHYANRLLDN